MPKAIKILLYLATVFLLQELLFRFLFPLPEITNLKRSDYMPQIFDTNEVQTVPYEKRTWASYPDTLHDFIHDFNGYGFRDEEWTVQKSANRNRILVVGDSFVEGVMTNQESTIPACLQRLLGNDRVEVLNAGILGIGMEEYTRLITDLTPVFKPEIVILVVYANDISGRPFVKPELAHKVTTLNWLEPRLLSLFELIIKEKAVPFRWQTAKPFIPAIPDAGNIWSKDESLYLPRVTAKIAGFMRAGKFNVYRTNWVLKEEANLKQPFSIKDQLEYINDYVASFGGKLKVVYVPSRHQVSAHYYSYELDVCRLECPPQLDMTTTEYQIHRELLAEDCSTLGISFTDSYGRIKSAEQQGSHMYWNYDDHMRKKGYELVAQTIVEEWP